VHYSNYASYLSDNGNPKKARAMHQKAIKAEPTHHGALGDWAEFLNGEGEAEEAEAMYKRSIAGCTTNTQYVNYALFLMEQERYEDAEPIFKKALEIDPLDASTAYNYCCFFARQEGCTAEAVKWLRKAAIELKMEEVDWDEDDFDAIRETEGFQKVVAEHKAAEDAAAKARLEAMREMAQFGSPFAGVLKLLDTAPALEEAQQTVVHIIKGLLSGDEVAEVKALGNKVECTPHANHTKTFLHQRERFQKELPHIFQKLKAACHSANEASWAGKILPKDAEWGEPRVRCIEYHDYSAGGSLNDKEHFDEGSLCTLDVLLSSPGKDFEGGAFQTLEVDGTMKEWPMAESGDAIVFVSHKYHSVSPVTKGLRNVLIMELWAGHTCYQDHRCLAPYDCEERTRVKEEGGGDDGEFLQLDNEFKA